MDYGAFFYREGCFDTLLFFDKTDNLIMEDAAKAQKKYNAEFEALSAREQGEQYSSCNTV